MRDVTTDAEIARLIESAQQFESWAFDELYELYAEKLYRFILVRVGDQSVAEDLRSEVFMRVLNKIETFPDRTVAAFSAWIYRITRNLIIDHYRRSARRPSTSLEQVVLPIEDKTAPADEVLKKQAAEELSVAISRLTPDQQQVILLKFFEGMGNAQVAEILGKTEGAVKSLQHRALSTLGRLLTVDKG